MLQGGMHSTKHVQMSCGVKIQKYSSNTDFACGIQTVFFVMTHKGAFGAVLKILTDIAGVTGNIGLTCWEIIRARACWLHERSTDRDQHVIVAENVYFLAFAHLPWTTFQKYNQKLETKIFDCCNDDVFWQTIRNPCSPTSQLQKMDFRKSCSWI